MSFVGTCVIPAPRPFREWCCGRVGTSGPVTTPGKYIARLTVGKKIVDVPFEILRDPRSSATTADLQAQLGFLLRLRDKLSETHLAIRRIRGVREQVNNLSARIKKAAKNSKDKYKPVTDAANQLLRKVTAIEEKLYQTKNQSPQDPLNYPIRLNNKLSALAGVVATGDFRPTAQAEEVYAELTAQIDRELKSLDTILKKDLQSLNDLVHQHKVPAVTGE